MYNNHKSPINSLWAITNKNGEILWSRGGSSSTPKIMVYESEKRALSALNNSWTQQIIKNEEVEVKNIYNV